MQQNVQAPKDIADKVVEHVVAKPQPVCSGILSGKRTTSDIQKSASLDNNCVCPTGKKVMLTINAPWNKPSMVQNYYYCQ
jgi:hypothetical protein